MSFFSRLPVGWLYRPDFPFSFARAVWTWPVVGLLLGVIAAFFFVVLIHIGLSPWIVAFATLGFQLLITGGLHEDGLADTADGLGGGKDKEHKLSIMRDSRLGSYGALTLIIILGLQASALADLTKHIVHATETIILSAILSRCTIIIPIYYGNPARNNGMATQLSAVPKPAVFSNLIICAIVPFFIYPWHFAFITVLCCAIIGWGMSILACRHINGYTGDILGATQTLTATTILILGSLFS
ncbi:adenosylcobinamide-GDP ribazoletransferase [Commensalibacter oyaizuii]|uniref:Adenosylcobinamide-GDP ribazoletransferase n=1 Tax=Commensalibacter oyaizuii TaxID=3043873 RepID=A0ABT6Q1F5_9PROT|nr:adenosylcobinamide-GDP ribazoletransferase [Commensalibacter sp. TBRC 16381]MDI2090943.1 adenosylcobinamide-GDP ribazoletransferase [Commensalibacter sp. TBRC 16381]